MSGPTAAVARGRTFVVITLDAGNGGGVLQEDAVAPYDSFVAIRFNTDGTVETGKAKDSGAIAWSAAGEWIDPNGEADSSYSVRYTNKGAGADFNGISPAEDAWQGLGSQQQWTMNRSDFGTHTFTCDFEVRKTAGAPPATSNVGYTITIDNTL